MPTHDPERSRSADLVAAMGRYERARRDVLLHVDDPAGETSRELAAARIALVELLAADGWVPEPRVAAQVERDEAALREDHGPRRSA